MGYNGDIMGIMGFNGGRQTGMGQEIGEKHLREVKK